MTNKADTSKEKIGDVFMCHTKNCPIVIFVPYISASDSRTSAKD